MRGRCVTVWWSGASCIQLFTTVVLTIYSWLHILWVDDFSFLSVVSGVFSGSVSVISNSYLIITAKELACFHYICSVPDPYAHALSLFFFQYASLEVDSYWFISDRKSVDESVKKSMNCFKQLVKKKPNNSELIFALLTLRGQKWLEF